MSTGKLERLDLRASADWIARIDEWRRKQPDIPNRSEAIRRLVDRALEAEAVEARVKRGR